MLPCKGMFVNKNKTLDEYNFSLKESMVCSTSITLHRDYPNGPCKDGSDSMCHDPCVISSFKGRYTMKASDEKIILKDPVFEITCIVVNSHFLLILFRDVMRMQQSVFQSSGIVMEKLTVRKVQMN